MLRSWSNIQRIFRNFWGWMMKWLLIFNNRGRNLLITRLGVFFLQSRGWCLPPPFYLLLMKVQVLQRIHQMRIHLSMEKRKSRITLRYYSRKSPNRCIVIMPLWIIPKFHTQLPIMIIQLIIVSQIFLWMKLDLISMKYWRVSCWQVNQSNSLWEYLTVLTSFV